MLKNIPHHVAIIMDGNGRGAEEQNRLRTFGHQKGIQVVDDILKTAIAHEVKVLSLFAFSTENGNRPVKEINFIMKLAINRLTKKVLDALNERGVQFRGTGFDNQLPKELVEKLLYVQSATKSNTKLILNICLNYGGKQDILQAAQKASTSNSSFENLLLTKDLPPIDLLIRTGGEKRISNFMLGQMAYAEIIFEPTYGPAYNSEIFTKNLLEFSNRKRRFGNI